MESLHAYIPPDRRQALALGADLPERSTGAALFADISGFTPLTEALVRALGPQRGAEELPSQLNLIYDALIAEVDRYRGSVIGFSGDAITCWFDDDAGLEAGGLRLENPDPVPSPQPLAPAPLRAVACALAMQTAMQRFASIAIPGVGTVSLAIKVAVAAGPIRRFLVGDPEIQTIDVLAGATLVRLAGAEHQAAKGEVVLDEPAAAVLGEQAGILEWRVDRETGDRFAVLGALNVTVDVDPWPELEPTALSDAIVRPWLLPPVYERLKSGLGEFLTELRPAQALFMRFGGIDYDGDEQARAKLDTFIREVQRLLERYGSYMLQLTVGDKGSYLYAAFGAPLAYEDDTVRAVAAALELQALELPAIVDKQIGISQGRMRTGAYGGVTRRTYGVLGDEVNMAARLMQHAPAGQAYVSQVAQRFTGEVFEWELLPPLRVKCKSQPLTAFRLIGAQERRTIRLQEPRYALPMIGRRDELALIARRLDEVWRGHGQIVGVTAEAGMGKSRLLAEIIRLAGQQQLAAYGGECQSYGTNTSYLVWQNIWRGFFGLDPAWPLARQVQALEQQLTALERTLLPRLPLLGAVLNLAIPDTELTQSLDAKLRKVSLEALLVDCLRARSRVTPLLLVLEDCHWLDPLSHDLLEVIGRAIATMPVLILMAYRPLELQHLLAPRVNQFTHFVELPLIVLPEEEVEQLVSVKIVQLYGGDSDAPAELIQQLSARAQGNPFYIEELLNYLHDRGVDLQQPEALAQVDLPISLHALILSRIDQLTENQKILLKVASVIGRLFRAAMLWGIYNQFGDQERVRDDLTILSALELTPLDTPDPELAYLFKHILTQEVAYETLPYATRALLHDQIGQYIERTYALVLDQYVDLLAYHYDHSQNEPKRREYLLKAGEAAQANYANTAAIDYYRRARPLIAEVEQGPVLLRLGQVFETVGQWAEAGESYQRALALAEQGGDQALQAQCQIAIGELRRRQGDYAEAALWYARAQEGAQRLGDQATLAKALICAGTLASQQGDFVTAQQRYEQSLVIRRSLDDEFNIANVLNNMSIVAYNQGDYARARALQEESLAIRRSLSNKWALSNSLNNLGAILCDLDELDLARVYLEEALGIQRAIGDPAALALTLHSLANLERTRGAYEPAFALYQESVTINLRIGDRWMSIQALEDLAWLMALLGEPERALRAAGAAVSARAAMGAPLPPADQAKLDAALAPARPALGDGAVVAWEAGQALTLEQAIALLLASA
jgi:predicted ATPase/class 3 adenylate cyclase